MPLLSLAPLLDVRGIRHAALLDARGVSVMQAGGEPDTSIAQAGRAVAASLIATLGGELQDLLIDLEGGPVLLTLTFADGTHVSRKANVIGAGDPAPE